MFRIPSVTASGFFASLHAAVGLASPGELVSYTPLPPLTREACASFRASRPDDTAFPIERRKIVYETVDENGRMVRASGLLAIPAGGSAAPVLAYSHGTVISKEAVPSRGLGDGAIAACYFATAGFRVAAPDYLGLGDAPGAHPYLHADTEASAGADLLRAIATSGGGRTEGSAGAARSAPMRVFITGYSQGGHAAVALHRLLEKEHAREFEVVAAAPMAGPYDTAGVSLTGTLDDPKAGDTSLFSAYVLSSYQRLYGSLWRSPGEVFKPGFEGLPGRFEAQDAEGIARSVPPFPSDFLRADFLAAVRADPEHPLREALKANQVFDWKPRAPVLFIHAGADKVVHPGNSKVAFERMRALGADTAMRNVGASLDHGSGMLPSFVEAARYLKEKAGSR